MIRVTPPRIMRSRSWIPLSLEHQIWCLRCTMNTCAPTMDQIRDRGKRYASKNSGWIQERQCPYYPASCQESLISQNTLAWFKAEWISATLGRAFRSSIQHSSTVLHSSSLNPRRFAPSGFSGRIPPVTMRMIITSD